MSEETKMIIQAINELRAEMNQKFEQVNERFNQVDEKFEYLHDRIDHQVFKVAKLEEEQSILKKVRKSAQ